MMTTNKPFLKGKSFEIIVSVFVFTFLTFTFCSIAQAEEKILEGKTVNINTGTEEELAQIPLVGEDMAERIIEYREENGDFQVIEELLQIDGFSRKLLRRLKPFLLLEGLGGDDCTC
jgi:competence protein ComEA